MVESYTSMQDFYLQSDYAQFVQEHRSGGTFNVRMIRAKQEPHAFIDPAVPELHMVATMQASGYARFDFGGGWIEHPNVAPDIVDLQPANQTCHFQVDEPHEVLVASIPSDIVREKLDEVGIRRDPFECLYGRMMGRNGQSAVLRSMWQAIHAAGPATDMFVDGCVIALLGMFCATANSFDGWSPPVLEDTRLDRVVEFIEEHFSTQIVMDDLAKVAGMSTIHFSRAFKKSLGTTPHAFLTQRRLLHAKALLRSSKLSITEVALAAGFGSSAHFASVFSRKVGFTPSAFRAGQRGDAPTR